MKEVIVCTHKYWLRCRPGWDAVPDGYTDLHTGLRSYDEQIGAGFTLPVFGWVQYSQPLTFEDCWKYELLPDDPIEYAHFAFWLFGDRDAEEGAFYENDYTDAVKNGAITIEHSPEEIRIALEILLRRDVDGCPITAR